MENSNKKESFNDFYLHDESVKKYYEYKNDWNKFIYEIIGSRLDYKQQEIVWSVQNNRRTSVSSGHARGKDFVTANICVTFLYLYCPSKVITTAPTQRQVEKIMMSEVKSCIRRANSRLTLFGWELGGNFGASRITFPSIRDDWFLEGFKSEDKSTESWTGFHSDNILVAVTEASGIVDETFSAIEGILTGKMSRFLIVGNPNRTSGEFYNSFRSKLYKSFKLSCLDAPNVINKDNKIPGQVDFNWIDEHVNKLGWCTKIPLKQYNPDLNHFEWNGNYYDPSDSFLVKVMGEFPRQSEGSLVPLSWIDAANKRWYDRQEEYREVVNSIRFGHVQTEQQLKKSNFQIDPRTGFIIDYRLGADIAGMGIDTTVFCHRFGDYVADFETFMKQKHMVTAGRLIMRLKIASRFGGGKCYVDTIGEGAGVCERAQEIYEDELYEYIVKNNWGDIQIAGVKFSKSGKGKTDKTGFRRFVNERAYCYWAIRDALDPNLNGQLALPPDEDLNFDLTELKWKHRSDGAIIMESKEEFKKRIKRSPDKGDSLAVTFSSILDFVAGQQDDSMKGVGIF